VDAVPVLVVNRFLGILALVALAITVAATVALVTRRVPPWARDVALPLATAVALVTTLGSLYYSEVAGYPPCTLCWYQRIAIYPQVIVLGVAALRRDRQVWRTAVPLAAVGAASPPGTSSSSRSPRSPARATRRTRARCCGWRSSAC